jgi:hypothetical protein
MEAFTFLVEAFLPTLVMFGLFRNGDLSNAVCASAIAILSLSGFVFESMATFFCYLIIDMAWRDHKMPLEILMHHVGCSILTFIGLLIAVDLIDPMKSLVCGAIACLLNMEITTPVLHAAKFAKKKESSFAGPLLALLIFLWIPFRLLYPFLSIYYFYLLYKATETWAVLVCVNLVILLVVVQVFWFFRLCVLFGNAAMNRKK